jgi:hypothetical protein
MLGSGKKTVKAGVAVSGWSRGRAIGTQVGRAAESVVTAKRQLRDLAQVNGADLRRGGGRGRPDVEEIRSEISEIVHRLIDQNEGQTLTALSATIAEFEQAIAQELDHYITTQRNALLRSRQALETGASRPAGQETDRRARIDEGLGEFEQISAAAAKLERELIDGRPE